MGKVPISLLHDIAVGKKFPVDRQIEKELFLNMTVNWEFLSNGDVVVKRYGNLYHVKMVAY